LRTVKDTNNGYGIGFNTVKDQVAAKYPPAKTSVLMAGNQGERERIFRDLCSTIAKGANKVSRPQRAVLRDVFANSTQVIERSV
jgi:hypothetical protein